MATVTPFLWFDMDLAEPINFYSSLFAGSEGTTSTVSTEAGPVFSASIEVAGQTLILLNGGPSNAGFTEAISMMITVETQDELDELWDKLTSGGGEGGRCGWLKDRFGLSWQIVPSELGSLLGSPNRPAAERATRAMLSMGKLDISALRRAFAAEGQ